MSANDEDLADCPGNRATKSGRKSRLRRSTMSGYGGEALRFDPSDDDWRLLAGAVSTDIRQQDKDRIKQIVDEFLYWEPMERNAPFCIDEEREWEAIRATSIALRNLLLARGTSAVENSRIKLAVGLQDWRPHDPDALDKMKGLLFDIAHCCSVEVQKSKADEGFREGDAWATMVVKLNRYFDSVGLPAGVAKDGTSPFVVFIATLQGLWPENVRRHGTQSPVALAAEINRRRKSAKDAQIIRARGSHHTGTL